MPEHGFTLILSGDVDTHVDELGQAGGGDTAFDTLDGMPCAHFHREAPSLAEAVASAISAVEVIPGLRVLRIESGELVTISEIAARLGRTTDSVRHLIARRRGPAGFPPATSRRRGRSRLWRWPEVAAWAGAGDEQAQETARTLAALNAALERPGAGTAPIPEPAAPVAEFVGPMAHASARPEPSPAGPAPDPRSRTRGIRALRIAAVALAAGIVTCTSAALVLSSSRSASFTFQAQHLQAAWTEDVALGVPQSRIAPLRAELASQGPHASWWSPAWWSADAQALLDRLQRQTFAAFAAAVQEQRARAQAVLAAWQEEVSEAAPYIPAASLAAAQLWPTQLGSATTPVAVAALVRRWQSQLDATRTTVAQARLDAEVAAAGGPSGLIAQAAKLVPEAAYYNLDSGDVPTLEAQLQTELSSGAATTTTTDQLYAALNQLDELLSLNSQISVELRPIFLLALQAAAEGIPGADILLGEYNAASAAFQTDRTYTQISDLQAQLTGLQAALTGELAADQCGHDVGSGKVITVSITLEELVEYDNGCEVNATPITAGRPEAPTLTGTFSILTINSPFQFISPWPPSSDLWYPPTWVSYADMWADGGYFLHDAPWESPDAFGPGSEFITYNDTASRGCIQVPTPAMAWLFHWATLGTPVIITP
jgi:hypothetical protein